jgi:hypothetical protein
MKDVSANELGYHTRLLCIVEGVNVIVASEYRSLASSQTNTN